MGQLIKVLWVEDDPDVTLSYPVEASQHDLDLTPFSCWDDAKEQLKSNYNLWHAIILDANCKVCKDDGDSANKFLPKVLSDIKEMNKEFFIPWFVLSGGSDEKLSDLLSAFDDIRTWCRERDKLFYSKNTDRVELYKDIKKIARDSDKYKVLSEFSDVLDLKNDKIKGDLIEIIKEIRKNDYKGKELLNRMRDVLEDFVLPEMKELGVFKDIPDSENITINAASRHFNIHKKGPEYVIRSFHALSVLTNAGSHGTTITDTAKLVSDGKAPYLLHSCLYDLLNIIFWLKLEKQNNLRT